MESRKSIRKRLKRQQNSILCQKGMALTTICASTIPLAPWTVLADDQTNQDAVVQVVDQASETNEHIPETGMPETVQAPLPEETNQESAAQDQSVNEAQPVVDNEAGETEATKNEATAVVPDITPEDFPPVIEEDQATLDNEPVTVDDGQIMPFEDVTNARSTNPQAFIQQVGPMAQQVAGANDLYASIMIAQAILESGWGQSLLTKQANNMFGIKGSYNGQFVEMKTLEDDGKGNLYEIIARFRKYPSLKESFEDNAHVLRTTSFTSGVFFYSGAWRSNTTSYREAAQWLQGRYATDTTYASKLINLIETYNLTQYDSSSGGSEGNDTNQSNQQETAINQQFRTTAALNIRADASTSASITGSLANQTTFQAVARKTGTSVNGNSTWYRISGRGWVSGAYVTAVNNTQDNNQSNNQETTINQQFRTTAALNVRADASTSARITGSVARQATIQATARKSGTSVNGNTTWYRINSGWVSGAYLQAISESNTTNSKTYTVKSGDTLWQIAVNHGTSVNQLMSWNNLSSALILVGQRLIVAK